MRARQFNWHGHRFVSLRLEAEPGGALDAQSRGLFERAGQALEAAGLTLGGDVVRTRVFGRTREARDVVSAARGSAFTSQARHATSSYVSPPHLSAGDVALDLLALAPPHDRLPRKVTEMDPVQPFIRHLVCGPFVFHAGMTNEHEPTLRAQCAEILTRAGERLAENGCGWSSVIKIACFLHRSQTADELMASVRAAAPVPLENASIELVDGYSRPGKLVEIEVTALKA